MSQKVQEIEEIEDKSQEEDREIIEMIEDQIEGTNMIKFHKEELDNSKEEK